MHVSILSVGTDAEAKLDFPNAQIHAIPAPKETGPRSFWRFHENFKSALRGLDAEIYHASDLYALPAITAAASRQKARVVYDARELYPYVAGTIGRPLRSLFWRRLEQRFIRRADAVITVSEGIAQKLVELYKIRLPTVIYNVPETGPPTVLRSLRTGDEDPTASLILHQGQMREHRGCELLVDAMRDVEHAILVFLGNGPLRDSLAQQAVREGIADRVRFVAAVPPAELLAYTASADVGVTLLEDVCLNHHLALPNKLFEYLTAGLPVIASDLPEIRKVVRRFDVGQLVQTGNRTDLAAALKQVTIDKSVRERWRRNIPQVLETFNWRAASQAFLQIYHDLLPSTR